MPLLISVEEAREVLTMADALAILEEAYTALGNGEAVNAPVGGRLDVRVPLPEGRPDVLFPESAYVFGSLQGAIRTLGVFAIRFKSDIMYRITEGQYETLDKYCVQPGQYCGLVLLFSIWNGELLAILQDGHLQHVRVGATAGLGAKVLAREDAESVGMLGSGGMARTYLEAFTCVRPIRRAKVFSPHRGHREAYAREMSARLEIEVQAVDSAKEACAGVDILAGCTDSAKPVIEPDWLRPGMHVTPVVPYEMPEAAVQRVDVLVRHLAGGAVDYAVGADRVPWAASGQRPGGVEERAALPTLAELLVGRAAGRTSDEQITCFYNVPGSGIQFAAVGLKIYELAKQRGLGRELPLDWFLQSERD